MRLQEICNLRWANVNLILRDIHITKSKSGKAKHIPVNDTLYEYLNSLYGSGKRPEDNVCGNFSFNYVSHKFIKTCKLAGIKNFVFNSLRHTFASYLVMNGVSIFRVSKLLGHDSVRTTEKYYAHLSPQLKEEEIDILNKMGELAPLPRNPYNF